MTLYILLVHASRIGKNLEGPATFGVREENSAVGLVKPERIADSSTPRAGLDVCSAHPSPDTPDNRAGRAQGH